MPAAGLEHVQESHHVGIHVCAGVQDAVAHAGLGGEVDDVLGSSVGKRLVHRGGVRQVGAQEGERGLAAEQGEAGFLQLRIVVAVDAVEPDHGMAAGEAEPGQVETDEPGGARDQEGWRRRGHGKR